MSAEKIAEVIHARLDGKGPGCHYRPPSMCPNLWRARSIAADLAPLLAAEREAGRAEQLTDADRRNLAAVYGYELGATDALREAAADYDATEARPGDHAAAWLRARADRIAGEGR